MKFPLITTLITGASISVYYYWQKWTPRQCRINFVFTETNFYNLKNYHSLLLSPLSYENNFFFYANLPGLIYSGYLIEKFLGARVLLTAYFTNCLVSAATTVGVHRQIGFHKVQQRGRFSNSNGNATLFFTSLFTAIAPGYRMFAGKSMMTTMFFYYLTTMYYMLFFTNHFTDPSR